MQSAHSFGLQGSRQQKQQEEETSPSLSIPLQSVRSEGTMSGSTTTRTVALAQALPGTPSEADAGTHSSWSAQLADSDLNLLRTNQVVHLSPHVFSLSALPSLVTFNPAQDGNPAPAAQA
jgi:hypothetical protein